MRGHTNAELLICDDGYSYVAKGHNNPFGIRVLVSEWIGTQLLHACGLPAPEAALIRTIGKPGSDPKDLHVGSRYPGDPYSTAVYDFLPDCLFDHVENWGFLAAGVIAFDVWVANTEIRQAIFARSDGRLRPYFIDNTHLFGGPTWAFVPTHNTGRLILYPGRRTIQRSDFFVWIERFRNCGDAIGYIRDSVPDSWLSPQDQMALNHVVEQLQQRSNNLYQMLSSELNPVAGANEAAQGPGFGFAHCCSTGPASPQMKGENIRVTTGCASI